MTIIKYDDKLYRSGLIALWKKVFSYDSPHNQPELAIDNKIKQNDGLFWIAIDSDEQVTGSIIGGYDGHRGWIYSLAVDPAFRNQGLGSQLLHTAEQALYALACPKINLQIMPANEQVVSFYEKNGYIVEARISMGKKQENNPKVQY